MSHVINPSKANKCGTCACILLGVPHAHCRTVSVILQITADWLAAAECRQKGKDGARHPLHQMSTQNQRNPVVLRGDAWLQDQARF